MARRGLDNDHAQIDRYTFAGKLHLHEKLDLVSRATRNRRSTLGTNGRIGQSPNK